MTSPCIMKSVVPSMTRRLSMPAADARHERRAPADGRRGLPCSGACAFLAGPRPHGQRCGGRRLPAAAAPTTRGEVRCRRAQMTSAMPVAFSFASGLHTSSCPQLPGHRCCWFFERQPSGHLQVVRGAEGAAKADTTRGPATTEAAVARGQSRSQGERVFQPHHTVCYMGLSKTYVCAGLADWQSLQHDRPRKLGPSSTATHCRDSMRSGSSGG